MPRTKTTKVGAKKAKTAATAKSKAASARKPAAKATKKAAAQPTAGPTAGRKPATRAAAEPMAFEEAMRALEAAGSEQTRKTYARHGVKAPMFGVSFATLKALVKRIRVDHALAKRLFATGNHDARMLAVKVADPARVTPAELDAWAKAFSGRMCGSYVAMLAAESPHGIERARAWLASKDEGVRCSGWALAGGLASLDTTLPDAWFTALLDTIERTIHTAPNAEREAMNSAVVAIGCRNAAVKKAALAAAKRIGKVEIDHGDTACKTQDAAAYIEKAWAHAKAKQFDSPAAQERSREPMRTRC